MAKRTETEAGRDWKYKVEDGARTMIRASEIKKEPKLYQAVLKEIDKQRSALMRVLGEPKGKSLMTALRKNKQEGYE